MRHHLHLFDKGRKFILNYVNRPWYPGLIAVLAGLDLFVVIVPTDIFLISAVFGQPKRWISIAITIAVGSTLGAAALALLIHYESDFILNAWPSLFASSHWGKTETIIQNHGIYAVFFGAVGPLPLQPFVVISALSHMSLQSLTLAMLAGRTTKFLFVSWCASHAPRLLEKFWVASPEDLAKEEPLP